MLVLRAGHGMSSEPCHCRHFWFPQAGMWKKSQAGDSSEAGAPSLWGPHFMSVIRVGLRNRVRVVSCGLFSFECGGSLERELRL
eukprot:1293404-Pyramimonas_sp.AAC.1